MKETDGLEIWGVCSVQTLKFATFIRVFGGPWFLFPANLSWQKGKQISLDGAS